MTTSYSSDPTSSLKDEVRFLIGDTASPWSSQDEEINFCLVRFAQNTYLAGGYLCRALAARNSGRGRVSIDGLSIDYTQRSVEWLQLGKELDALANELGQIGALPYSGAISTADGATIDSDTDRIGSKLNVLEYPTGSTSGTWP